MYFLTEDHADKIVSDINPAYLYQNSSMIRIYYVFDEDLMNAVARKNYDSSTVVSLSIRSV